MTIVQRILALLQIGEEGKINSFFEKQRKTYGKEIKNLKKNIEILKDQEVEEIDELQEKIEDGKVRIEEAYTSVTLKDVATNEAANAFADVYWSRIEKEERAVKNLENKIEDCKKTFASNIEDIQKQIAERERRLEKIQ